MILQNGLSNLTLNRIKMKTNKTIKELLIGSITVAPMVYYIYLWSSLPATIPIHFDAHGNANNYGSKGYIAITLFCLTIGVYLFLRYIPKIDPKKNFSIFQNTFIKLRFILAIFFTVISFIIIDSVKYGQTNTALIFIIISFLISILGNYTGNIRPNYFIGIRTPWTLNNELIWKRTHYLTGRLWFVSGIVMGVLITALPTDYIAVTFISSIVLLAIYPLIYSFIKHITIEKSTKTKNYENDKSSTEIKQMDRPSIF